jgi:hypothetical protein
MSEACPGERSYVGLLRVAGARATRRGGVEPRARTDDAPLNPRGCWGPGGDGRWRTAKHYAECHLTGKLLPGGGACRDGRHRLRPLRCMLRWQG